MRSGTCVCSPECVSSELRGVEGRLGTKTCFTSEFLYCRSSSSGVLLRSGVGRAFATSGAVFASRLGPVLCVLRCCDFGSAVAMAGRLGVTWERAELASDGSGVGMSRFTTVTGLWGRVHVLHRPSCPQRRANWVTTLIHFLSLGFHLYGVTPRLDSSVVRAFCLECRKVTGSNPVQANSFS